MGKYNNNTIDKLINNAMEFEKEYRIEAENAGYGTQDYYYFHGKSEAYHDMVHELVEMKNKL